MCGIFGLIQRTPISGSQREDYDSRAMRIQHRGPDDTRSLLLDERTLFVFHRLAINDITTAGNQPLVLTHDSGERVVLICNGEIYNHRQLAVDYELKPHSGSDCEIILHLYVKLGIQRTLELLSGYFAFALWDERTSEVHISRDMIGVRSLYIATTTSDDGVLECVEVASEMKAIVADSVRKHIRQFPPCSFVTVRCESSQGGMLSISEPIIYDEFGRRLATYHNEMPVTSTRMSQESSLARIRDQFEKAVYKRFMSERPFGVFLSGGLDSSLVAALVAKHNAPNPIHTFSIGMTGSTDLAMARKVAEHIGSIHHEHIVTADQMLAAIPDVIRQIETWDTTTVRASTPMYLLSKYIRETTDIVVIFSGEGSDEASGSYLYFYNAPSEKDFHCETMRLLKDLCYYDCLRCDKATAGNGLEVRVPFLDNEFLKAYMDVPSAWKIPVKECGRIEKWFLRKAFDGEGLLPVEVLWRKKEAFSDGVSSTEKSWYQVIQEHVDGMVSDSEFHERRGRMDEPIPVLKESYYYRKLFDEFYPNATHTIPYYWLPRWSGNTSDPSARVLSVYS